MKLVCLRRGELKHYDTVPFSKSKLRTMQGILRINLLTLFSFIGEWYIEKDASALPNLIFISFGIRIFLDTIALFLNCLIKTFSKTTQIRIQSKSANYPQRRNDM